jgi:hypothetical protein
VAVESTLFILLVGKLGAEKLLTRKGGEDTATWHCHCLWKLMGIVLGRTSGKRLYLLVSRGELGAWRGFCEEAVESSISTPHEDSGSHKQGQSELAKPHSVCRWGIRFSLTVKPNGNYMRFIINRILNNSQMCNPCFCYDMYLAFQSFAWRRREQLLGDICTSLIVGLFNHSLCQWPAEASA